MVDSTGGEMRETELRRVQRKARAEGWRAGEIEYPRLRSGSPYITVRPSADDPGVRIQSEAEWEQTLAQFKGEQQRRSDDAATDASDS